MGDMPFLTRVCGFILTSNPSTTTLAQPNKTLGSGPGLLLGLTLEMPLQNQDLSKVEEGAWPRAKGVQCL